MQVIRETRTDRLIREVVALLELHRSMLDQPMKLSTINAEVRLNPDGMVRNCRLVMSAESLADGRER